MTINNLSIDERKAYRAKIYQPVIETLLEVGYKQALIDEMLEQDETWFNDSVFSLNMNELLSLYKKRLTNNEDFHEVLAKFTSEEDAADLLYTYLQLHKDKIIGAHWLWCVIERVAAGESEESVLADFYYYKACE